MDLLQEQSKTDSHSPGARVVLDLFAAIKLRRSLEVSKLLLLLLFAGILQPGQAKAAQSGQVKQRQAGSMSIPPYDSASHRELPVAVPPATVIFHVSPHGAARGDGSEAHPFRSLQAARDGVRSWKRVHRKRQSGGSIQVHVHGGIYSMKETLRLGADDSGTAESPVIYMAEPGERPIFEGGIKISSWTSITDAHQRDRLDVSVRSRVLQADLKLAGVTDFGDATNLRACPELFVNGVPQTLARWPDQGFVKTGEILGADTFKKGGTIRGCRDGKFRFVEARPSRWTDEQDVRLYGYWFWDWFEEFQKVKKINPADRSFTLAKPYSHYGYRKNQRYFAVNVFRELNQPGEWYLDRKSGIIYWLPPEGLNVQRATIVFSLFKDPCVIMDNVEHVILKGLVFQESRGDGLYIQGGHDDLIAGCILRRLGGDAVVVTGGRHHGVFGCTMYTLGCGGMRIKGGDRKSLARGDHFVENCTVYDISRLKRTYTPAVLLDGCGNRIAHNLFERIPSSAMRIEGNDQLIELNVIRHVVEESDDQGGLDMWGNPLYRGIVIRWNSWSDIVGGTHCGAAGIRLDDMISGVTIHGNIFRRCGALLFGGIQIHGGKENLVDGNLFIDCFAGISFSRWSKARWLNSIERFLKQAGDPTYLLHYPALAGLKEHVNVNFIYHNVFSRCGSPFLRDGNVERMSMNVVTDRSVETRLLSSDKSIRSDPQLCRALMDTIPVDDIGPYNHPWRAPSDGEK